MPTYFEDPYGLLTWSEWWTGAWNPLDAWDGSDAADEAREAAENSGNPGLWNGPGDAYRHALWNCLMAQRIGADEAKKFGDAHESGSGNNENETQMDLHNNCRGRQLGAANPNGDCEALIQQALDNGELLQLSPTGGAVPPNVVPFPTGRQGVTPPTGVGPDPGVPYNNAPGNPYPGGGGGLGPPGYAPGGAPS